MAINIGNIRRKTNRIPQIQPFAGPIPNFSTREINKTHK